MKISALVYSRCNHLPYLLRVFQYSNHLTWENQAQPPSNPGIFNSSEVLERLDVNLKRFAEAEECISSSCASIEAQVDSLFSEALQGASRTDENGIETEDGSNFLLEAVTLNEKIGQLVGSRQR